MGNKAVWTGFPLALAFLCSACTNEGNGEVSVEAPPRATTAAPRPTEQSIIAVPITADASMLQRAIEGAVPRTLWQINQHEPQCIAPQHVRVFGENVRVTPRIACTIIGEVTRGGLTLRGEGRDIVIDIPIRATVSARDVGGVLHGETATGSANVRARIRLDLQSNWRTRGRASIEYRWRQEPGIDFLGQRIRFTRQADRELAPVVHDLERMVEREIANLNLRGEAASAWRQAFTSLELNRENPPVWLRITPQRLAYSGIRLDGRRLHTNLALEAVTETFVGPRPSDLAATPLPALSRDMPAMQLDIRVPVIADYRELEPVLLRALVRRSAHPFVLPALGPITAQFERVQIYGTTDNRIAVGINVTARTQRLNNRQTHGTVWITAMPVNAAGSAEVSFTDIAISGDTDRITGDLLLQLARSPEFAPLIAAELTQNFTNDLSELETKIRRAVSRRHEGAFVIAVGIDRFEIGQISAFGDGLHLPARITGRADIALRSRN
jgi:hypothetical protein